MTEKELAVQTAKQQYFQSHGYNCGTDFTDGVAVGYDAARQEPHWIPIESAPKDGREVILKVERRAGISGKCLIGHWMPGGHCIEDHPAIDEGWYFWNGSMFDTAAKPTHWMPIPDDHTPDEQK